VENIFALSGNAARIAILQKHFNTPHRYGKGLDWTGYTVHDAAGILLRYLKSLPEPVIPYECYEPFTATLIESQPFDLAQNGFIDTKDDEWHTKIVREYQILVQELPPLHKQLLLYILDTLAVFASKADRNRMTTNRLAGTFNPAILSRKPAEMDETQHRLAQDVVVFLIENQDDFLIGMTEGSSKTPKAKDPAPSRAASVKSRTSLEIVKGTGFESKGSLERSDTIPTKLPSAIQTAYESQPTNNV